MAGLKGQSRIPQTADPRSRRNSANLASNVQWIGAAEAIALTGDGELTVTLTATGGLEVVSSALGINLDSTPGLVLASSGIKVLLDSTEPGLQLTSGLKVLLATDPGLEFSTGLRAKIKAASGVTRDSDGLSVNTSDLQADTSTYGTVKQQTLIADQTVLTDSSGGTSGSGTIAAIGIVVTDPADTPADADALRDDLVANTIPSIETELTNLRNAVATLAAYSTTIEDKINAMIAAEKTADQMSSV